MKVDYLIAGQGIAGSVLALTLEQRGKTVAIIDEPSLSASSRIAAGVYNPFNFRRTIPTWKAQEASDSARQFYTAAEAVTGSKFHEEKTIVRIFGNEAEQMEWKAYLEKPDPVFAQNFSNETAYDGILAPNGCGIVGGSGIVYTSRFLEAVAEHFNNRGYYIRERVDHSRIFPNENSVSYDNRIEAAHVIFCEGHLSKNNPYFDSRTIAPTKGELIHVSIPGLNMPAIVHGPVYLAPLGNDLYACGATFDPGKNDEALTAEGEDELTRKLKYMIDLPFEVVGHYAGVRPAGRDRKPVLGRTRNHSNLSIFNGFGSKAVLLAPYLAQLLANHLENGAELPREISLSRFKSSV